MSFFKGYISVLKNNVNLFYKIFGHSSGLMKNDVKCNPNTEIS
jgi:hypothetical protein